MFGEYLAPAINQAMVTFLAIAGWIFVGICSLLFLFFVASMFAPSGEDPVTQQKKVAGCAGLFWVNGFTLPSGLIVLNELLDGPLDATFAYPVLATYVALKKDWLPRFSTRLTLYGACVLFFTPWPGQEPWPLTLPLFAALGTTLLDVFFSLVLPRYLGFGISTGWDATITILYGISYSIAFIRFGRTERKIWLVGLVILLFFVWQGLLRLLYIVAMRMSSEFADLLGPMLEALMAGEIAVQSQDGHIPAYLPFDGEGVAGDVKLGEQEDEPRPGWYYAQGDPPGTQRYWDSSQWVGHSQSQISS